MSYDDEYEIDLAIASFGAEDVSELTDEQYEFLFGE